MNTPAPPPTTLSLAERMAWMHAPVRLSHSRLPWFVRWYFEAALHSFFCTLEQALLTLLDLQRQGKLEPWPEKAAAPATSCCRMKSNPTAQRGRAGSTAVPCAPDAAVLEDALGDAAAGAALAPAVLIQPAPHTVRPQRCTAGGWLGLSRSPYWVDCAMPPGRGGGVKFSSAGSARWKTCDQIIPVTQLLLSLSH